MGYLRFVKKSLKLKVEALVDDIKNNRDKTFFDPIGMQVYCGRQGSGKTISAVSHVRAIKKAYPLAILATNMELRTYNEITFKDELELKKELSDPIFNPDKDYIRFNDMTELEIALTKINNGFYGVVFLVDEIHTYFNSLESKNIPPYVFTEISQQRKQRKAIIGTSQLFTRMAKPFREQCDNMIQCFTLFGFFTVQIAYDGMSVEDEQNNRFKLNGKKRKIGWFFQTRDLRAGYDTYQKVVSSSQQYEFAHQAMNFDKKTLKALKKGR